MDDRLAHEIIMRHLRWRLCEQAKKYGIRATSRATTVSRTTIRKWTRRFNDTEWGLAHMGRRNRLKYSAPHNKTSAAVADKVLLLRRETGWGPQRLIDELGLSISARTVSRIIQEHGFSRGWHRREREYEAPTHTRPPGSPYAVYMRGF